MNINIVVMLFVFVVLVVVAGALHGTAGIVEGLRGTVRTFLGVWPLLLLAFGIAGMLRVVIPQDLISSALGPGSGFRGILVGWGAGALMPGAPYVALPVASSSIAAAPRTCPTARYSLLPGRIRPKAAFAIPTL